jgi:hypothetical protein
MKVAFSLSEFISRMYKKSVFLDGFYSGSGAWIRTFGLLNAIEAAPNCTMGSKMEPELNLRTVDSSTRPILTLWTWRDSSPRPLQCDREAGRGKKLSITSTMCQNHHTVLAYLFPNCSRSMKQGKAIRSSVLRGK